MRPRALAVAALIVGGAGRIGAQALTLGEALRRAGHSAYPVRIARGESAATAGQAVSALRGILPTLRIEASYLRSTDPLNAFGFALRHRTLTAASFDPAALSYPDAIGNLGTGIVMELPIVNLDEWHGRDAANAARDASSASAEWSQKSAALAVVQAYFGAVLASERVSALESGLLAARAHVRQTESLLRNGEVTRSDGLIAEIKAGEVEAALISASSDATLARQRLAAAIGTPDDTSWTLPRALPSADRARSVAERLAGDDSLLGDRADLRAAAAMTAAANADLQRARSLYLPRLNSFGRLDWNSASAPFGGHDSWTIGIMATWTPFAGATQIGETRTAEGRASAAAARAAAATAQAALDVQQADAALSVATKRLVISERSIDQSAEAHRIVARKYDGGLATVAELLDAAAVEIQARLAFADARFQLIAAAASRLRARGLDLAPLTALDQ